MRFFETEQSTCHLLYPFYAVHGLLFHLKHKRPPTWLPSWKKSLGVIILSWIDFLKINFNTPTCDVRWLPGSRLPVYTARNEDGVGCGSRGHWKGFFTSKAPWPGSLFLLRLCCTWEAAFGLYSCFSPANDLEMSSDFCHYHEHCGYRLHRSKWASWFLLCFKACVRVCVCILVHPSVTDT